MKSTFFLIIVLLVSFSAGFYVSQHLKNNVEAKDCAVIYTLINKQLGCEPRTVIKKHPYSTFVEELEQYIDDEISNNKTKHVSVYFRDMQYGPTFGIEANEQFAPASLLKVPLLITYLDLVEKDSALLSKKTSYSQVVTKVEQSRKEVPPLEPNTQYTIEDLLSRMIVYSDNVAYWLLLDFLTKTYSEEDLYANTLKELGLINPRNSIENTMTVKSYSSLFRQLYNSSYLSPDMSEKALDLLTKSKYTMGLVAGLPANLKVAHKFGELGGLPNGEKQLHDCGIIYYPDNPYLLCIMTRGDDFVELTQVIKVISEKVYKEVDSRRY